MVEGGPRSQEQSCAYRMGTEWGGWSRRKVPLTQGVVTSLGLPGGGSKDLGGKFSIEAAGGQFRTGRTGAFIDGGWTNRLGQGDAGRQGPWWRLLQGLAQPRSLFNISRTGAEAVALGSRSKRHSQGGQTGRGFRSIGGRGGGWRWLLPPCH